MFPLTNVKSFNFYRRYKWNEDDFGIFQDTLLNFPATLFAKMCGDAVLNGLNQDGASGLDVDYLAGFAVNSLGNLLAVDAGTVTGVTNNVRSLIVIRPVAASTVPITRPTTPFDTVYLNEEQTAEVVAIAGPDLNTYPAKAAGDVILFGVIASGGAITIIDESQCELVGKYGELAEQNPYKWIVGNDRRSTHRLIGDLPGDLAQGDRVRILGSETLNATVDITQNEVQIDCDPGVVFQKGTAATAFTLSGDGIRWNGGRITGFSAGGNKGIDATGDYCSVWGTRFANNTTDVNDGSGNTSTVGVISE